MLKTSLKLFMHNIEKCSNILKKSSGINTTRFSKVSIVNVQWGN